jgi:hypothetical protein
MRAFSRFGMRTAARMPMIAMTISSSMRSVGARVQELEQLMTLDQEAAEIGREYVRSMERGLEVLGVDSRVELVQPTLPGTVVFDLAGLERRWRVFEEKAVLLKDALEQSDFTPARELMWLLGRHVRIDFSRPVLRDAARGLKVEVDLARLNRERTATAKAYTPYSVPAAG